MEKSGLVKRDRQICVRLTEDEWLEAQAASRFLDRSVSQMARFGIRQVVQAARETGMPVMKGVRRE